MKSIANFIIFSVLSLILFSSCGGDEPNFAIDDNLIKDAYTSNETIDIAILDLKSTTIDSIQVVLGERTYDFKGSKGQVELKKYKFGLQGLSVKVFSNGKEENLSTQVQIVSGVQPQLINYEVINTFKHDNKAYTQGFEFHNGILYEGTGQYGQSSLRQTDYISGDIKIIENLPADHFGEGITILNDTLYQLTWKNNKALVYDAKTLKKIKEINYPKLMEGWGLTNDGKYLYAGSDSGLHVLTI